MACFLRYKLLCKLPLLISSLISRFYREALAQIAWNIIIVCILMNNRILFQITFGKPRRRLVSQGPSDTESSGMAGNRSPRRPPYHGYRYPRTLWKRPRRRVRRGLRTRVLETCSRQMVPVQGYQRHRGNNFNIINQSFHIYELKRRTRTSI